MMKNFKEIYTLYFSKPENHRVYNFLFVKRFLHSTLRIFMCDHYITMIAYNKW